MELDAHRNTSSLANRRKGEVTGGEGKYQEIEQKSGKKSQGKLFIVNVRGYTSIIVVAQYRPT